MKNRIKKNTKTPMLAALLCAALLILSIFLPYVKAEAEYVEILEAMEQDTSLSLHDLAQVYLEQNDSSLVKILVILGGLAALTALCAFFRKPALVMIFDVLATAWSIMIRLVFSNGTYGYAMSIGSWLCFVACAGLFASAVWMLAVKNKTKKRSRARANAARRIAETQQ